jgi:hypothetical protein
MTSLILRATTQTPTRATKASIITVSINAALTRTLTTRSMEITGTRLLM